jgi:hypothetical protein
VIVVRYVALVALVIWVGGLVTILAAGDAARGLAGPSQLIAYGPGGVILVSFVLLKFVGPPPRAFFLRFGLVALMLALTFGMGAVGLAGAAVELNVALGLVLLTWYVRE